MTVLVGSGSFLLGVCSGFFGIRWWCNYYLQRAIQNNFSIDKPGFGILPEETTKAIRESLEKRKWKTADS